MIVFVLVALLLASAVPAFLRARKRSHTSKIAIFARSSPLPTV
jgi:type II secretory pathway pseudopilin PulG